METMLNIKYKDQDQNLDAVDVITKTIIEPLKSSLESFKVVGGINPKFLFNVVNKALLDIDKSEDIRVTEARTDCSTFVLLNAFILNSDYVIIRIDIKLGAVTVTID